jgi:hypothetical protein
MTERPSAPIRGDDEADDRDPPADRISTAHLRQPPDYIIIGAQRAGTTSMYRYLSDHPNVGAAYRKEVHYFDRYFGKGWDWYLAHFPVRGAFPIVGEASPYYLFHPEVPRRLKDVLPDTKFLVLLRNPIDRAQSHYHQKLRLGHETLPFASAVAREEERLAEETDPIGNAWRHFTYTRRGHYAEQLERWFAEFSRDRFLILKSETFFAEPEQELQRAQAFLGLPPCIPRRMKVHHLAEYPKMDPSLRRTLRDHFAPHNRRLSELLGEDLGWDG